MTTPEPGKTEPPAEPAKGDGDYGKPPTMGDLRSMVAETVESALKPFMDKLGTGGGPAKSEPAAGSSSPAAAEPGDLAGMVDAALAKVLGERDKKAGEDAHAEQHRKIEAAAAERRPVERPKRSRWLGSIWDE